MTIRLKRDALTGVIKNVNDPIILRGGHYDLFQQQGQGNYALLGANEKIYDVAYTTPNEVPCSKRVLPEAVHLDTWDGEPWTDFFQSCQQNGINLLRIFASDGTRLGQNDSFLDQTPFQKDVNGKYMVRQAAENSGTDAVWNMTYFNRLRSFADQANAHQICLLVTLFNSYDLSDDYTQNVYGAWKGSFWNPNNTNDPVWGETSLVPSRVNGQPTTPKQRQNLFIVPTNNIHYVQTALIKRFTKALRGRGNVIFEIMNEPRQAGSVVGGQADYHELVDFYTNMIRWIRDYFESDWNPLICINDFNFLGTTQSEMDYWLQHRTSGYDLFDVISYHGLSRYRQLGVPICNSGNEDIALTDKASITNRFNAHRGTHKTKGIIFSSDGTVIKKLRHYNSHAEMTIADGQIDTTLTLTSPSADVSLRADLHDWATWCLGVATGNLGVAHFQNHSSFQRSFEKIRAATTELALTA
jgi:hypothetical protein